MANDVTLCQTIEAVIGCYESECDRAEIRRDMADLLVSQFEKDENQVNEAMLKKYQPLWQEGGPDGDEHFEGVLPSHHRASGRRPLPRTSRPVQGKLLATHKGCEIREWFDGWDAVTVEFMLEKETDRSLAPSSRKATKTAWIQLQWDVPLMEDPFTFSQAKLEWPRSSLNVLELQASRMSCSSRAVKIC